MKPPQLPWVRVPKWPLFLAIPAILALGALWLIPEPARLVARILPRPDTTWRTMEARGTWRVGLDPSFPPFETLDAAGQPVGYDVDLAHHIAEQWNMEVEVVAIGFDGLLGALQTGKVDSIVSALPYDPRATRDFAFSSPYFEAGVRLAVRTDSSVTGPEDLITGTVAVEWGSMGDMVGRRMQRDGKSIDLLPFPTPEEAVEALVSNGDVDALLVDNVTLRQMQGEGTAVKAVGPALESNPYVIATPFMAHELQTRLESTLQQLAADGTLAEIENKWFGPVTVLPSE